MSSSTIPLFWRCPQCGQDKPFTTEHFHRSNAMRYGLCTTCKECAKAKAKRWHWEHRDFANERSRQYAAADREASRRRKNEWYAANAEYARKAENQRYHRDKANGKRRKLNLDSTKTKVRQKRYVENHRDRRRTSSLRYAKSLKGRAAHHRRRALINNAPGSHTADDLRTLYALQEERCAYCGITLHGEYHVDHMQPIARGGSNWPDNLALTCSDCNLSKGAKTPGEWMAIRGW
jgi:5-methylcytosine-specific restriction endonuclease McrA